jgi:hypothetical protein
MDGVTSRFDLGEPLDPLDEFRVEDNIRAFSSWLTQLLHQNLHTHRMCMEFRAICLSVQLHAEQQADPPNGGLSYLSTLAGRERRKSHGNSNV